MDMVAQPLSAVVQELDARQLKYLVTWTRPSKNSSDLLNDCCYVIRQTVDSEGVYQLVIAAKLGGTHCNGL